MLGLRGGVPAPRLAFDPHLPARIREIEFGEEDASGVEDRILVHQADAVASEGRLGQALEPAARECLSVTLVEQEQHDRRTRTTTSAPAGGDRPELVEFVPETERAVEGSSGGAESRGGSEQGEGGGHGQHPDRRHLGHVLVTQAAGEVGDRSGGRIRPPTLPAENIDPLVPVESVESVEARGGTVGEHGGTGSEHCGEGALFPGSGRCRCEQHAGRRAQEDLALDEALFGVAVDAQGSRLIRTSDAVLARHHLEQFVDPVGSHASMGVRHVRERKERRSSRSQIGATPEGPVCG